MSCTTHTHTRKAVVIRCVVETCAVGIPDTAWGLETESLFFGEQLGLPAYTKLSIDVSFGRMGNWEIVLCKYTLCKNVVCMLAVSKPELASVNQTALIWQGWWVYSRASLHSHIKWQSVPKRDLVYPHLHFCIKKMYAQCSQCSLQVCLFFFVSNSSHNIF